MPTNKWIRFLRNYGPIPTNDNMYDETIQRALARSKMQPIELPAQHLEWLVDNFRSDVCHSIILTGTAGDGKTEQDAEDYVFPSWEDDTPFGSFPRQWTKMLAKTELAGITPHVLRHSFASIGNCLGFTEATIGALVGHSRGTVTSRYIHTVDTALVTAADSIAGYIQGPLDGVAFSHTSYALDRDSRKSAFAHFLGQTTPLTEAAC